VTVTPVDDLAAEIAAADRTVAFTGAGVSTESGVPDFRSEGGIWDQFDERDLSLPRFRNEPAPFWADWLAIHAEMGDDPDPNPAHEALADLEDGGHLAAVVTQNVDGLHAAAGSDRVVHLHGTGRQAVCRACGAEEPIDPVAERASADSPPHCRECGRLMKPDTVLFGEPLPDEAVREARTLAETADVFLVVGSSLTVEPAASLPERALSWDATLAVVNRDETRYADRAAYAFRDDAGDVLPAVANAVDRSPD
jgi:NAD-dependent deacetylase